ncbi:MAG: serine/threonine protein phosphatase [Alphaproteobacteria bacterium]|nr:serine/threonine protein phosphatase [Alphaproteobacteria bacterium]
MPLLKDARTPEGLRIYAIGDIHGRLDLLRAAHARIAADLVRRPCPRYRVIHTGDYIDRGPESAGVIAHLIEFTRDGEAVCLAGNHDLFLTAFLKKPADFGSQWLANGGVEALASYGVEAATPGIGLRSMKAIRKALAAALPPEHLAFFEGLKLCEQHGDYLFVHAGVRPGVALRKQKTFDLTFIREPFLSDPRDHGFVVVHGHTTAPAPVIRPNRIGIDTKAYASDVLTCLVLENGEKGFLDDEGYAPIQLEADAA